MYSYLTFALSLFVLGTALLSASRGRQRTFASRSAAYATPTGLADIWFAPSYWQPDHVIGAHFSVEGMLFSFGNGAVLGFLTWPLLRPFLDKAKLDVAFADHWHRFMIAVAPGFAVFLLFWDKLLGGLPIMQASFVGFAALIVWLGVRGKLHWPIGMAGALLFVMVYKMQTVLWSVWDPDLERFWSAGTYIAGPLPLTGLPGDELLWAAFYGFLWPHIIALTLFRDAFAKGSHGAVIG